MIGVVNSTSTNQQPLTLTTTSAGNPTAPVLSICRANAPPPENGKIYSDVEAVVNITVLPNRTAARGCAIKLMIEEGYIAIRTDTYEYTKEADEIQIFGMKWNATITE